MHFRVSVMIKGVGFVEDFWCGASRQGFTWAARARPILFAAAREPEIDRDLPKNIERQADECSRGERGLTKAGPGQKGQTRSRDHREK
jgi:hypothetical protein